MKAIRTCQTMKKHLLFFSFAILLVLFLSGCDPCNPEGPRSFGTVKNSTDPEGPLIALAPIWGPCGYGIYSSSDGGLHWETSTRDTSLKLSDINSFWLDCTQSCEFVDPINDRIRYKILPGKTLLLSMDKGNTWKEELRVPAWNRMGRNYVNYKFMDINIPRDIRGPFGAITDPKTGNLIVAMGFEGVLVRTKNGQWKWVNVDRYSKIQPARFEMIGLILPQEWLRGPLIALFLLLFGLIRLGFHKWLIMKIAMMILALWFILIPFVINELIILMVSPVPYSAFDQPIYELLPPLFIAFALVAIILINFKSGWQQYLPFVTRLGIVSILGGICYLLAFILWSQGILLTSYTQAYLLGIALFATAFFYILLSTRKARQKPLASEVKTI